MMGAIFAFSSIPSKEMPNFGLVDFLVKKGGHALGYGLLALTYLHGLRGGSDQFTSRRLIVAWFLTVVYSVTDEFHQSFVSGRHPAVTDVMIDSFGAALALIFVSGYFKQK
jgi:VanZ family protein